MPKIDSSYQTRASHKTRKQPAPNEHGDSDFQQQVAARPRRASAEITQIVEATPDWAVLQPKLQQIHNNLMESQTSDNEPSSRRTRNRNDARKLRAEREAKFLILEAVSRIKREDLTAETMAELRKTPLVHPSPSARSLVLPSKPRWEATLLPSLSVRRSPTPEPELDHSPVASSSSSSAGSGSTVLNEIFLYETRSFSPDLESMSRMRRTHSELLSMPTTMDSEPSSPSQDLDIHAMPHPPFTNTPVFQPTSHDPDDGREVFSRFVHMHMLGD